MDLIDMFEGINLNGDFHSLEYLDYLYNNGNETEINIFMEYLLKNISFKRIYYETESEQVIQTIKKAGKMINNSNTRIEQFKIFYELSHYLRSNGILKSEVDELCEVTSNTQL
jgi:hypothetical protein